MDKLNVCFVGAGNASLASHRLRILKPAELLNVGCGGKIEAITRTVPVKEANVLVFSKHFNQRNTVLAASQAPEFGQHTVFDICDDHFDRENGPFYEKMCEIVDAITCNTENMQERIYSVTGELATIIPDPYTFPEGKLEERYVNEPQLLWFGHASNLSPLMNWLDHVGDRKVTCITNMPVNHPKVEWKPWRPGKVERLIKNYDIVLIPSGDEPWVKMKSPNRAVDSIIAGKWVIADSEEIYGDLRGYMSLIKNPGEIEDAIDMWKNDLPTVEASIKEGQEFIKKEFGNDKILDGWLSVFEQLGLVTSVE